MIQCINADDANKKNNKYHNENTRRTQERGRDPNEQFKKKIKKARTPNLFWTTKRIINFKSWTIVNTIKIGNNNCFFYLT